MYAVGDRVELAEDLDTFEAGHEGYVAWIFSDGNLAVVLDTDPEGNPIPEFPLPPLPPSYFDPADD